MNIRKLADIAYLLALLFTLAGCGSGDGSSEPQTGTSALSVIRPESWVVTLADYVLAGTVSKDANIVAVNYTLNDGAAVPLVMQLGRFEAALTLQPGVNDLLLTASDDSGAQFTDSFQIYYARFDGMNLSDQRLIALRPLVVEIMHSYGLSESSAALQRAKALRDWVARHMVHPDRRLHPDNSPANLAILPTGKTWADVNAISADAEKVAADQEFWGSFQYDGFAMLDALLGPMDLKTGIRSNTGFMEKVDIGRFRIRDIERFPYPYCTYQVSVLQVLWAAAGFQSIALSSHGHDPAAVFIPGTGWVYSDPTFNEEYQLDTDERPLSPASILELVKTGNAERIRPQASLDTGVDGPLWDPIQYISEAQTSYFSYLSTDASAFGYLRALMNSNILGGTAERRVVTVGPYSNDDPAPGPIVESFVAFPDLDAAGTAMGD